MATQAEAEGSVERAVTRMCLALAGVAAACAAATTAGALLVPRLAVGSAWTALAAGAAAMGTFAVVFAFASRFSRGRVTQLRDEVRRLRDSQVKAQATSEDLGKWAASAIEQVRDLSERIVQIHELERGRMARDLHDSVGQALAALQLDLEMMRGLPGAEELLIGRALASCEDAMQELRRVVYDLRPPELSDATAIQDVLRAYVERFEIRAGVPTSFRATGRSILSEELATCLLRVLQEALTNVSRHAFAREVGVQLRVEPREIVLEVADDGQGFDPGAAPRGRGLRGIEERCAFLGGRVRVESVRHQGTKLEVHLPLAAASGEHHA